MLRDVEDLSRKLKREYSPIYEESDVKDMLTHIEEYPFKERIKLDDDVTFEFIPSGHIIGAAQLILYIKNGSVTRKIAFTGDLGNIRTETYYANKFEPIQNANLLVGESTYASKEKSAKAKDRGKDLEKINPNLIQYDDNGNAIKVRTGEVKEYREELQKTIKEYEKLLSMKLEEKANASYDKNNSQPEIQKRLDALQKAKDEMDKLFTTNPATGISQSKLGSNWLDSYLKGDKETKKRVDDYVKQIQVVKDAEKKAIETGASGSKQVNSDRTSYLENLFGNTEAITKAKDKVKNWYESLKN